VSVTLHTVSPWQWGQSTSPLRVLIMFAVIGGIAIVSAATAGAANATPAPLPAQPNTAQRRPFACQHAS
jgi:hypothetical protein